jgi:hypothetical protein
VTLADRKDRMTLESKTQIDFDPDIADRVFGNGFLIGIMIGIEMVKQGSDFEMRITGRFL